MMASRRSRNRRDKRAEAAEVQRHEADLGTNDKATFVLIEGGEIRLIAYGDEARRLADEAAEKARTKLARKP